MTWELQSMPHHGLISRDCPVACLLTVLSRKAWNPLTRASSAPCDPPETVGDVLDMRARHQLGDILAIDLDKFVEVARRAGGDGGSR
jgi:hypothetical protein